MRLSLILATHGAAPFLERCMDAMLSQEFREFEVLLMDQNQDDRHANLVAVCVSKGLSVMHHRLSVPGLAAARNRGIELASGEFVAFPDDDCWYEPGTLRAVVSAFVRDPNLGGVVANWVEQTDGGGNPNGRQAGELNLAEWRNFRGGAASSISQFWRKSVLVDLAGFDVRLGIGKWFGAAEETDLMLRALSKGFRISRVPEARVHHRYGEPKYSGRDRAVEDARSRARGTGAMYAKHGLPVRTVLRGLAAPLAKPLLAMEWGDKLRQGLATSLGRWEGMRRWRREEVGR